LARAESERRVVVLSKRTGRYVGGDRVRRQAMECPGQTAPIEHRVRPAITIHDDRKQISVGPSLASLSLDYQP
jgi:hypothetical protein